MVHLPRDRRQSAAKPQRRANLGISPAGNTRHRSRCLFYGAGAGNRELARWPTDAERSADALRRVRHSSDLAFNGLGAKPIAWAELYASLDLLIGAKPPTLSGFGRAGGSLNLGPFSLGVEAQLAFFAQNDTRYLWCQVTGRIELFFFDIEATVTVSFGNDNAKPTLPSPDRHPLDREVVSGESFAFNGSADR